MAGLPSDCGHPQAPRIENGVITRATTLGRVVALVILALAPRTYAAEAGEESTLPDESIVTDRPTDSASPELVPRRMWQIELGYKFNRLDTDSGSARRSRRA